jgi:hypothetical protein
MVLEYHVIVPPSMVFDGTLEYFKSLGFIAIGVKCDEVRNYQNELEHIKSLGLFPYLDIENIIWKAGAYKDLPISYFEGIFTMLYNAGWRYVGSEGGRTGDGDFLSKWFGYVNFNCDQCGKWLDFYRHISTVINSYECFFLEEIPSIKEMVTEAYNVGITNNGVMIGVWSANNECLQQNVFNDIIKWSIDNKTPIRNITVFFDLGVPLQWYFDLGVNKIITQLQSSYGIATEVLLKDQEDEIDEIELLPYYYPNEAIQWFQYGIISPV